MLPSMFEQVQKAQATAKKPARPEKRHHPLTADKENKIEQIRRALEVVNSATTKTLHEMTGLSLDRIHRAIRELRAKGLVERVGLSGGRVLWKLHK